MEQGLLFMYNQKKTCCRKGNRADVRFVVLKQLDIILKEFIELFLINGK